MCPMVERTQPIQRCLPPAAPMRPLKVLTRHQQAAKCMLCTSQLLVTSSRSTKAGMMCCSCPHTCQQADA